MSLLAPAERRSEKQEKVETEGNALGRTAEEVVGSLTAGKCKEILGERLPAKILFFSEGEA